MWYSASPLKLQRRRGGTVLFQLWSTSRGGISAAAQTSFSGVSVWRCSVWHPNRSSTHYIEEKCPTLQPTKQCYWTKQQGCSPVILSVILSGLPTLHLISAWKHLSPAAEPGWMTVIMWHDSEQKTWTLHAFVSFHCCVVVVTVFKNITVTVSSPDQELSPRKQPPSLWVRVRQRPVYWWRLCNYVI